MAKTTEGKSLRPNARKLVAVDKLNAPQQEDELYSFEAFITSDLEEERETEKFCWFSYFKEASPMENPELIESFLNHPPLQAMRNPITMLNIQQHQFKDLSLNNMRRQNPHRFPVKEIEGRSIICYRDKINDPMGLWRIALPSKLVVPVITWYHHVLGHCGINQLYDSINAQFKAPALRKQCKEYWCEDCQRNK
eukprot:2652709-Ditylum_brightwellii.AAC.1